MNFVEPIRDRKKIAQTKTNCGDGVDIRDLLLFVVGINYGFTHFRLTGYCELIHFLDAPKRIRRRFWIKELKRGKRQEVVINNSIQEA